MPSMDTEALRSLAADLDGLECYLQFSATFSGERIGESDAELCVQAINDLAAWVEAGESPVTMPRPSDYPFAAVGACKDTVSAAADAAATGDGPSDLDLGGFAADVLDDLDDLDVIY